MRGCTRRVKRDGWVSRVVKGSGGPGGILTEYQPPADILALIQSFFQANPDFFAKSKARAKAEPPSHELKVEQAHAPYANAPFVSIPLYNVTAAAGGGILVDEEHLLDMLQFSEAWIRQVLRAAPADLYLIYVDGESMEPTLRSGDVLLLDRRATKPDREGVYIMRMNGMLLVKRLQALPGGIIKVTSDNSAYDAFTVRLAEMQEQDFAILGRVVWSGRRM